MATILYKDGEAHYVEARRVQQHLQAGFSVTKEAVSSEEEKAKAPTFAEADTNNTGKLSPKEIRAAAKKAGIEGWETRRLAGLRKELGYVEE